MGDTRAESEGEGAAIEARAQIQVQIIHELCEWQMENPARFRALLKDDEDAVSWVSVSLHSTSRLV